MATTAEASARAMARAGTGERPKMGQTSSYSATMVEAEIRRGGGAEARAHAGGFKHACGSARADLTPCAKRHRSVWRSSGAQSARRGQISAPAAKRLGAFAPQARRHGAHHERAAAVAVGRLRGLAAARAAAPAEARGAPRGAGGDCGARAAQVALHSAATPAAVREVVARASGRRRRRRRRERGGRRGATRVRAAAGKLPGAGAQRRLLAAVVHAAEPVAVAGGGEGGVPGARDGGGDVRRGGAQPEHGAGAAQRGVAQGVPAGGAARAGVLALQRVPARPVLVPVLRAALRDAGADVRPRDPALPRRQDQLAQRGDGVRALQPPQGAPPAARAARHEAAPRRAPPVQF
ncbi:hypothetical protein FGB62_13g251 [Gracilaria domingensis]|nr:hypothetical protein FGB62_13g251 [Gracilaria domingensis]